MRIAHIKIRNILGIEKLDIAPGKFVLVTGQNGSGKSSVLAAIRAGLGGGCDATLIRAGAEAGETVIDLDDGTHIKQVITPEKDKSKLTVTGEFGKISKAKTYLETLTNALALEPVTFLLAKPSEQVVLFYRALPLKVTSEEIAAITGDPAHVSSYKFSCEQQHALTVLDGVEKVIFDQRTGLNRALKEKRGTVEQLQATLPTAPAGDGSWANKLAQLEQEQIELTSEHTAALSDARATLGRATNDADHALSQELARLRNEQSQRAAQIKATADAAIAKIRADAQSQIDTVRDIADRQEAAARSVHQSATGQATADVTLACTAIAEQFDGRSAALAEALGEAKASVASAAKADAQRTILVDMERGVEKLNAEAQRLTGAIEGLRQKKIELTATLPIAGLDVHDGELFVDGIPYATVNESRRIRIAIDIARLRSGQLGLLAVDGMERLDSASFELFRQEAEASGLQLIVARVTDEPELTIHTEVA